MSEVISLRSVGKVFVRNHSPAGTPLWRRLFGKSESVHAAVSDLTFSVSEGEILGFIGPNGAGKSTTLKMLSGILRPTTGEVRVLGKDPMADRHLVAKNIAAVFGQKSQLWIHLPPLDSFRVLGEVYGLGREEAEARIKELSLALGISQYLDVPVRKLSLGERIRCEIAASLIHSPKVLFLDEPTIGLDIDAKRNIRALVRRLNEQYKTTIILTSHDLVDIERLCDRVIVINKGQKVYMGPLEELRERYLHIKRIAVRASEVPAGKLAHKGIRLIKNGTPVEFEVDTRLLPLKSCLEELVSSVPVDDITIHDQPLEDIILSIYSGTGQAAAD